MRTRLTVGGSFLAAALLAATGASASLKDDGNGMAGWKGFERFQSDFSPPYAYLAVNVEYCVYEPGQFGLSFPGQDPSGGTKYIYAYQVFNNLADHPNNQYPESRTYVNRFSVGLNGGDEQASNIGFIDVTPGQSPNAWAFTPPNTAGWDFNNPTLPYGSVGDILIFASPFGPELDTATVKGGFGAGKTLMLPSPVPEPGTIGVLVLGAMGLMGMRRRRD